jgi:hypothetical protein
MWDGLDVQLHNCPDDGDREVCESLVVFNELIQLIA